MRVVAKTVEVAIAKLKKNPDYRFESPYPERQLLGILHYRGLQLLRGLLRRLWLGRCRGLLFCGRYVIVEHGYLIKAGPNLILEDMVQLNALSEQGIVLGRNVTIGKGAVLACTGVIANRGVGIEIGDHSAVGAHSFLGGQGGIRLGNNVIMGPGVRIFSENHNYQDLAVPIRLQGESRKGVVIEDDCWIGSGVTILDGVTIGGGTLVAAGSVVTKSVPPCSIVAGVPAKVIRERG